jgi:hypothetical protein
MPVYNERDKEKIHWVLYDAVPATPREVEGQDSEDSGFQRLLGSGNVLSFFQDLQRKTKLETNMEASGLLSRNSYEIRAMRIVIAPLPQDDGGGTDTTTTGDSTDTGGTVSIDAGSATDDTGLSPRVIEEFIYNSVTTLRVGEKLYFEGPTFLSPGGAGLGGYSGNGESFVSHGEANPMATWRFAEPIVIPPQQSFRLEVSFPRGVQTLTNLSESMIRVWAILDGYLTRDVQ